MSVDLSKKESQVQLLKRQEIVRKVCLKKTDQKLTSRVGLIVDRSASMKENFENGTVQAIIERVFPIALNFNDNEEMEFWTFNESFEAHPSITFENYYNYITDNKIKAAGGTYYAPVMYAAAKKYLFEEPACIPNYIIYITDGDNFDTDATNKAIKFLSNFPIFFQFIGIGKKKDFKYLKKLDNMKGRYIDNANFFSLKSLSDVNEISDEDLYKKLITEYPSWLTDEKVKKMIAKGDKYCDEKKVLKKFEKIKNNSIDSSKVLEMIGDILEIIIDVFLD